MECIILLHLILLANVQSLNAEIADGTVALQTSIANYSRVEDTFKLMKLGENYLTLREHKDNVLVLGNTGSGKTTFTHFFVGDNTKMRAVETSPGSGDYIILDDNNKIGHGIDSKTIIPERVVDVETNTAYYDCPGFSDTRNTAFDIASNYFIKKTVDHAKSVKMLFVISYSSVRIGVDRTDFMKLVRHATELIRNIQKFENSVALVVTKVDNEYYKSGRNFFLRSDERITANIADYITKVRDFLQEKLTQTPDPENKIYLSKSIVFLSLFLRKKAEIYPYILLFRRPDMDGVLTEIELLQGEKKVMKNLVDKIMIFTKKDEDDFGFTISDSSKNHINALVEKIYEGISQDVVETAVDLQNYYHFETTNSTNIYALNEAIDEMFANLLKIEKDLKNVSTFKEFISKFINFINQIDAPSARDVFLNLLTKYNYMEFLQLVSKKMYKILPAVWIQPLENVKNYLADLKKWYTFLIDMREKLSSYKTHTDLRKNSVILKVQRTSAELVELLKSFDIKEINDIQNMVFETDKQKDMNDVLNSVFVNDNDIFCSSPDTLTIKGNFVRFSDVPDANPCPSKLKTICIFALNSVFVDKDLIRIGQKLNVFIVAPKWEIVGDRKIVLDGKPGELIKPPKAQLAQMGKPGVPGENAGNFMGIGRNIVNGEHLSITANGGVGGRGQHGGDGVPGIQGTAELPRGDLDQGKQIMAKAKSYYRISEESRRKVNHEIENVGVVVGAGMKQHTDTYVMNGNEGTPGGDGSKAGAGGKGGLSGKVSLFGFNDHRITTLNRDGAEGLPGEGGKGGEGGLNGKSYMCSYVVVTTTVLWIEAKSTSLGWTCIPGASLGKSADGKYNPGINYEGIASPEAPTNFHNPSLIVNNFKHYMLENINDNIKKHHLTKFYFHLNEDSDVKNAYISFEFLHELQNLEKEYYRLKDHVNLLPFYESLLKRISEYALRPKNHETESNYKIFLNYLYTATLSKVVSMKNKSNGGLIVDMTGYFNLILSNFQKIEKFTNEIIANEYNINFKKGIDEKIMEGKSFIGSQIIPEIHDISSKLEAQIETLINEITDLRENSEKEKDELMKQKAEIMNAMEKRMSVENFKLIGVVANFMGPYGEAVNDIIQISTKVQPGLTTGNIPQAKPLPAGVQTLLKKETAFIENYFRKKATALEHYLDSLITEINKYPHELGDLLSSTTEIKSELAKAQPNMEASKILSMTDRLLKLLTDKKGTSEGVSNVLKTFSATAKVASTITDMYLLFKNDSMKLDKISEIIQSHERNVDDLRKYQYEIYQIVVPMFNMLQHDMRNYETDLPGKSSVALDVSKWNIQTNLKDMQLFLSKITSGFKVQDEMVRLAEKLEEALHTLIHVYDRIENYNEKKELADYVAGITIIKSKALITSDSKISLALSSLDLIIKSNIAVAQFEKAMDGFKQFIFPFANYYLEEYELPSQMPSERTAANLIARASQQIENLSEKITEHKLLLHKNFDQYIYEEYFQSGENYNGPFAVWDNYNYGNEISRLLSGEEVAFKADILRSTHEKNAIKFNTIEINLKSNDKNIIQELESSILSFDLYMTHSGNSYYRCNNAFYIINSESQVFYYSFEKNGHGEPVRKNQVYTKIKNGEYMLSPYTTWILKLKPVSKVNFEKLSFLKGKVNLELVGHAQYVSPKNTVCDRNLRLYYKTVETISVTDVMNEKYAQ